MIKRNKTNLLLLFFTIIFLTSRLVKLDYLPIFNDEAMYLNWGRMIVESPAKNLFVSLTDGQQPFFVWLAAISYWLGKGNFLFWGRFISVLSGLGALILIYLLGKELFNRKAGLIASLLYLVAPFTLWHDRLAIKDCFLLFLATAVFYLAVRQAKTQKWRWALGAGIVLGIALLTKSIAYFFAGLYPLTVLLSSAGSGVYNSRSLHKISLALILAFLIQSLLYFSPLSFAIGQKNMVFLLSPEEFLKLPIQMWRNNLYSTLVWWWQYYQPLLLGAGLAGVYGLIKKKELNKVMILISWIFLPIVFEIFMAKIYIPRYFLFTFVPLSLIIAYGIWKVVEKIKLPLLQALFVSLLILPNLYFDKKIIFEPEKAPLPQIERWQYLEGWPSGYGLTDLADYLVKEYLAKGQKVLLLTEKETLVSSGLALYLTDYPNLEIRRSFDLGIELGKQVLPDFEAGKKRIVVLHHSQEIPETWPVNEVKKIKRLVPNQFFLVYEPVEE